MQTFPSISSLNSVSNHGKPSEDGQNIGRAAYAPDNVQWRTRNEKAPAIVLLALLAELLQVKHFACCC
jgi:hypothetical protein